MNAVPLTAPRLAAAALLLCALGAAAQESAPPPEAAASASAPAGPDPRACARFTDQASATDVQATGLRSQRGDLAQLAGLLDRAVDLWTQAVAACEGRPRERARRNLTDTRQLRDEVAEQRGSGEACDTTQRHASSYQDLARAAMGDRRFTEAARLFRKAEDQWDLAHERCTGKARDDAAARRDQSEVDGHNAEHCAPLFDQARESTQRLRNGGAALSPTDRQRASLGAETLWRDAVAQCKGSAQDLARQNADTLARERGTPWVATRSATAPVSPTPPAAATQAAGGATATAAARPPVAAPAPAPVAPGTPSATVAAAVALATGAAPPAPAAPRTVDETLADGTRFTGVFALDKASRMFSGRGLIRWTNGDEYEGDLDQGKRQGQGRFSWPSGQRYEGDWDQDQPHGKGRMRYPNGNLFQGTFVRGEPQGEGLMTYAGGDRYQGTLQRGVPHGAGTYTWTHGQVCTCRWEQGVAQGPGEMRFASGNVYQGGLKAGAPDGQGRMQFASGEVYEGQFAAGVFQGRGRYDWTNGDRYEGQWKDGRKEGQGEMRWKDGRRWVGVFKDDEQEDGEMFEAGR